MKPFHFTCVCLMLASTPALAGNPVPFINQPLIPSNATPGSAGVSALAVAQANPVVFPRIPEGSAQTRPGARISEASTPASPQVPVVAFAPAVTYSSGGQYPSGVVIADVNGDGKPDLVVLNRCPTGADCNNTNNGSVGVLLGNGDGTFQPAVTYGSGGTFLISFSFNYCINPCRFNSSLAVADVNGDGKPDLLVANEGGSGNGDGVIAVLLGKGDGTFQPAVTYDSGGATASAVAVADVNGDGKLDVLVTNAVGSVAVLLGNGDGTFQPPVTYASSNNATSSVALADLNGDGKLDLVLANACAFAPPFDCEGYGGSVGVLLGNGDGTFQPAVNYFVFGWDTFSVAVADVNGDGKPDVLVASSCNNNGCIPGDPRLYDAPLSVLLGNGDGTLQQSVTYDSGGEVASSVAVGDINADGELDLITDFDCVAGVCPSGSVSVLPGNADGTFQTPVIFAAGGTSPQGVAVADVDGDGKPDVVVSTPCTDIYCKGGVAVLLNLLSTATALASSVNPSAAGQTVTFTATVTHQGPGRPTGTVSFFDGTMNLGSSPLNGGGTAAFSISTLVVGAHPISAIYSGDAHFGVSASPVLQQLVQGSIAAFSPTNLTFDYPTVGITSPPQAVVLMNTGNIPLTIVSIGLIGTDDGDFAQTNTCGTSVPVGGSCNIAATMTPRAAGTRRAAISVTDNARPSPQAVALVGNTTDFSLSSGSPTTQTVTPGQAANYSIGVAPVNGFNLTVSFSCNGAPAQSRCTVTPSEVRLDGSTAKTVDVAVVTAGTAAVLTKPKGGLPNGNPFEPSLVCSGLMGIAFMAGVTPRHRRWRFRLFPMLGLACLLAIGMTMPACGGGSSSTGDGTPTGTYTVTVTGTFSSGSTTVTQNTKLTLVVQ